MSFRVEEKAIVSNGNIHLLNNFLNKNDAKKIHEDRIIKSLYFDNKFFSMFQDSEEGIVPRKKIRLRNYSNSHIYLLEIKISSVEGRFKTSEKIMKEEFDLYQKKGILDRNYGICNPKVFVSYNRSYYKIFGRRITLDKNIRYQSFDKKLYTKSKYGF